MFKFTPEFEQWFTTELKRKDFNGLQIGLLLPVVNALCDRLLNDLVSHFTVSHAEVDAMKLPQVPDAQKPAFRNGCKYMIDYYNEEIARVKKDFGIS
jgi:hypothetical protein